MFRSLSNPVEAFRTAPVQFIGMALGSAAVALTATAAMQMENDTGGHLEWGLCAYNMGMVALNLSSAAKNIKLRDRLEISLKDRGFNERVMSTTTYSYCSRQAAFVACENTNYLEDYTALCEKNSTNSAFAALHDI